MTKTATESHRAFLKLGAGGRDRPVCAAGHCAPQQDAERCGLRRFARLGSREPAAQRNVVIQPDGKGGPPSKLDKAIRTGRSVVTPVESSFRPDMLSQLRSFVSRGIRVRWYPKETSAGNDVAKKLLKGPMRAPWRRRLASALFRVTKLELAEWPATARP